MKTLLIPRNTLSFFLWLIAAHSFAVGIGMLTISQNLMSAFGFGSHSDCFFRYQGGVFHIIMSLIYSAAAIDVDRNRLFIFITTIAKLTATVFLFIFYFSVTKVWIIIFSGIGDLIMGTVVVALLARYRKSFKGIFTGIWTGSLM